MNNKIDIEIRPKLDFSDAIKALLGIQFPEMDLSEGVYIIPIKNLPSAIKYTVK